jgi:environmental stress-induced protein Ves
MTTTSPVVIQADTQPPQAWRNGGGQTRELLAWPSAADWRLRISRADITANGPFSAFPGVARWFQVLSGNGAVLHLGDREGAAQDRLLLPGHLPAQFDGALAPGCTLVDGPTQDLNLMVRGGMACMLPVEADQAWSADFAQCGLYTSCGGLWQSSSQSLALLPHTLVWLHQAPSDAMRFVRHPSTPEGHPTGATDGAWWLGFTPEHSA